MSAVVCGSKRSYDFFEQDLPLSPVSKKLRWGGGGSGSPARQHSPSHRVLDQLISLFPSTDSNLLERLLEECGNDLNSAIKSLNEQYSGLADQSTGSAQEAGANVNTSTVIDGHANTVETLDPSNLPADGAGWVEVLVNGIQSASSADEARMIASRVLEILEKSISAHVAKEAAESSQKENLVLKEQNEVLMKENSILKRAVAIQLEHQKQLEGNDRELQHVKQLLSQYQEQLRTLEVNNYALKMHLVQAQQSSSIPGRFHPDVF